MDESTVWLRVKLNDQEMRIAAMVGTERQIQSASSPATKHGRITLCPWMLHINGAAAEIAVSRALRRYWPPSVGTFRTEADIPAWGKHEAIEVRWITNESYDLKIRDDDKVDCWYILVSGNAPHMVLHGAMFGNEAKVPEFRTSLGNGRPDLWCVPKARLYRPTGATHEQKPTS